MKVAIQGIRGSYSEQAVNKLLENDCEILECKTFSAVFESILDGKADFAVIPVWNKIIGEIKSATYLLENSSLKVLKETYLPIKHALIGTKDSYLEKIKVIVSQAEALNQCRRFLEKNSHLYALSAEDTAISVRCVVSLGCREIAAIGSIRAAEIYGGKVLRENISDSPNNSTLFYLVGERRLC
ncbi:MAG: hypothetical protein N2Z23_09275 [Pyrinomonadaceae bacterium]|nr:hypothetical protein [Pyrinomonadaceae bacterium]MCX7640613.1 hypothetical protein [Pyrinomonadaceae bacterium]MDW8305159.1 prephenate dehydratase domain-containing protein [Acidobacteriota bacterium]